MSEVKTEEIKIPVVIETTYNKDLNQEDLEKWLEMIRNSLTKFDVLVVYLNSLGGQISLTQAALEALHSYDKKVVWVSELFNASLATAVPLLNDDLRLSYPSSRFLLHSSVYNFRGNEQTVRCQMEYTAESDGYWDKVYMEGIGLTKKELKKITSFDNTLWAGAFMELGTKGGIDGMILKKLPDNEYLCQCRGGVKKIINVVKHKSSDVPNLPEYKEEA